MSALGIGISSASAIVDLHGNVLARARSGGMINPARFQLDPHSILFRFGGGSRSPREVAKGSWWIEKHEFEKLVRFGDANGISVGMAMRLLCLVPPEWNDASLLIRGRVVHRLLAWRGLGNSVVTPLKGGHGTVNMPHHNEIEARRLHQLFIPGLSELKVVEHPISIENFYPIDPKVSAQGFLYL